MTQSTQTASAIRRWATRQLFIRQSPALQVAPETVLPLLAAVDSPQCSRVAARSRSSNTTRPPRLSKWAARPQRTIITAKCSFGKRTKPSTRPPRCNHEMRMALKTLVIETRAISRRFLTFKLKTKTEPGVARCCQSSKAFKLNKLNKQNQMRNWATRDSAR